MKLFYQKHLSGSDVSAEECAVGILLAFLIAAFNLMLLMLISNDLLNTYKLHDALRERRGSVQSVPVTWRLEIILTLGNSRG